jgi:CheY-like chemotaxis protein
MKVTAAPLAINNPPPPARRATVRVLVVDRDRDTVRAIETSVGGRSRVDVEAFESAEQALTQSSGDSYDLCLLDYALDGVDGVMLGAMIRALNPGARLALMSEAVSAPLIRQAVEHGFQTVLTKPLQQHELDRLLDLVAGGPVRP